MSIYCIYVMHAGMVFKWEGFYELGDRSAWPGLKPRQDMWGDDEDYWWGQFKSSN